MNLPGRVEITEGLTIKRTLHLLRWKKDYDSKGLDPPDRDRFLKAADEIKTITTRARLPQNSTTPPSAGFFPKIPKMGSQGPVQRGWRARD